MAVDPRISEWGNPVCRRHTTTKRGANAEEKTTVIPRVAASESGLAQTVCVKAHAGL